MLKMPKETFFNHPILKNDTVKPRFSAPACNIIAPKEHEKFDSKKCFHSYIYVGNRKNPSMILTSPLKYAISGFNCKKFPPIFMSRIQVIRYVPYQKPLCHDAGGRDVFDGVCPGEDHVYRVD